MPSHIPVEGERPLQLLVMHQGGKWGGRIADFIGRFHPVSWTVGECRLSAGLPPVIDEPADFLPAEVKGADLLLALCEAPAAAQLIPELARRSGARAVIAPIDRNEALPAGLAAQVRHWLAERSIPVVFPRPFCSLTPTSYNRPPDLQTYSDPLIARFAERFGSPRFGVRVHSDRKLTEVTVLRDSACGCARFVAEGLAGCALESAEHEAGMLHHHFPCLAGMTQDPIYADTLMHVSGNFTRQAIAEEIQPYKEPETYLRPNLTVGSRT